jgi:hypothetical protein
MLTTSECQGHQVAGDRWGRGRGPGIHAFATEALTVPNLLDSFRAFGSMALRIRLRPPPVDQSDPTSQQPGLLQDCSTVRCPQGEGFIAPPGMTKRAS